MRKRDREWVEWFTEEFERATREGSVSPIKDRVPWEKVEDKGVELKVVNTNEPRWFDKLKNKWERLLPLNWCRQADRDFRDGLPIKSFGEKTTKKQLESTNTSPFWKVYRSPFDF